MRFDKVCLKMTDQNQNQSIISAPEEQTLKRKRGRPPKIRQSNETSDEETPNVDELLGQTVSGVLNGSFDAGYFVTVKPQNSNLTLTGLVFCPEKVLPITPDNDLAPKEKMYQRISSGNPLEIQVPSTSVSKNVASMVECDQENDGDFTLKGNELSEQGYEFQMASYYTPAVENLQDYRIVDHDEIMKEFEASACMNAPASVSPSKHSDYNLETMAEMESVYPETLINNELSENKEVTAVDPCLKLMDSVANAPSEAAPAASFDVNERPSTEDTVRSDLQLGITEAKYSTSAKMYHSSTKGLIVEKPESSDKPSEPPFFFNLNDVNKKSVTESLSFTLGDLQAARKPDNSSSEQPVQDSVSSELELLATVATPASNPTENLHDKVTDA